MEEAVVKAKGKAEKFLFSQISQLDTKIKNKEKDILNPSVWNPVMLLFEAHAYLANRKVKLKSEYGKKIRNLWLCWSQEHKKNSAKWNSETPSGYDKDTFYPSPEEYELVYRAFESEKDIQEYEEDFSQAFENESNIAMFRAIEILGIPGFQVEFKAVLIHTKFLMLNPSINFAPSTHRNLWFLLRSTTVQEALKQQVQTGASIVFERMKHHELKRYKNKEFDINEIDAHINGIIFLSISKQDGEYLMYSKKIAHLLIDHLESNGSLLNDTLTTCSFVAALCLLKIDPSNIIKQGALKWLLDRQNTDGSWDHWQNDFLTELEKDSFAENYKIGALGWRILSTVIVLETIDLITNDGPLPPWIPREKEIFITEAEPSPSNKFRPFHTKRGTRWKDVELEFTSENFIKIIYGEKTEERDFSQMGFKDGRNNNPKLLWYYLIKLAKDKKLDYKNFEGRPCSTNEQEKIRKNLERLKKGLKDVFVDIIDNPFTCKKSVYKSKFNISFPGISTELQEDNTDFHWMKGTPNEKIDDKDRVIIETFKESTQKTINNHRKNVQSKHKDEIEGKKDDEY